MLSNRSAILLGYFGRGNFGDDLLLQDLTKRLAPIVDRIVVVRNPQPGIAELGLDVSEVDLRDIGTRTKMALRADLVVLGPGGILRRRRDNRMMPPLMAQAFEVWLGQTLGKRTVLHNVSVDSADPPLDRASLVATLERLTRLTVRDDRTAEVLKSWGLQREDMVVAADPILTWDFSNDRTRSEYDVAMCMSASELRGESPHALLDSVRRGLGDRSVIGLKCAPDDPILDGYPSRLLSAARLDPSHLDWPDVIVTMRFHVAVVSFAAGRRTLGISKEVKMKALFEELAPDDYFDRDTRSTSELSGWLAERLSKPSEPSEVSADQTVADSALASAMLEQGSVEPGAIVDLMRGAYRLLSKQ